MTQIRKLFLSDMSSMADIHQACFGVKAWTITQIESSVSLSTTQAFGVELKDGVACFCLLQVVGDEYEVLTLATHPDHQRQGVAMRLMKEMIAMKGVGTFFLEVAADNLPAIAFYESLGFKLFATRKGYYFHKKGCVDALNYQMKLSG